MISTVFSIEAQTILQYVIGNSAMGNTIEKILILCIAQGHQDVKFIGFAKNVLKTYQNIQEDVYTFNSLPTIPKKN